MSIRVFARASVTTFLGTLLSLLVSCSGELENQLADTQGRLRDTERAAEAVRVKAELLSAENQELKEEIRKLKETPQHYFDVGLIEFDAGNWAKSSEAFSTITKRFPTDVLIEEAVEKLKGIAGAEVDEYLAGVDSALSLSDKSTYSTARSQLEFLLARCEGCPSADVARDRIAAFNGILDDWPEQITNIATMKLRYVDLINKPLGFPSAIVAGSTYYNCRFESQRAWRSFSITLFNDSFEDVNAYCRRGVEFCENLFQFVVNGEAVVRNLEAKYIPSRDICAEEQLMLTGWQG